VVQGNDLISHLPISVDGSCNGLQNFSAMLRDRIGGAATNLLPGLIPSDIYTEVAKVCLAKLQAKTSEPQAKSLIKFCDTFYKGQIPRGISKKPVMTLPYGSTKHSCTDSIQDFLMTEQPDAFNSEDRFKIAVYLTPILWESINEVIIASREAMDWLQNCATVLAEHGKPCLWRTPLGYLIYQGTTKNNLSTLNTQLFGMVRYRVTVATPTKVIHSVKQRSGISANFVHSMDACHLQGTIIEMAASGINAISCVHDEYGTHAADMDELSYILRQIFVKMYTNNNVLKQFKTINEELYGIVLPEIPSMGDLSLIDILESKYFFC
jgi:DNA-directed RNA polymerase